MSSAQYMTKTPERIVPFTGAEVSLCTIHHYQSTNCVCKMLCVDLINSPKYDEKNTERLVTIIIHKFATVPHI